ncbi:MAG TPA: M48 family metallopeptidase [Pyrinomonadaceae bacterium]|nr:M48 family metallopeptidase [Pyrinomonadaceae bacterium]
MPNLIIGIFLVLFIVEFVLEFILNELNIRQVQKSRAAQAVPEFFQEKISKDEYEQSARYTLAKAQFQRWSEVYGRIVTLFLLFGGLLPFLENLIIAMLPQSLTNSLIKGVLFCLGVGVIFSLASLPIDLYSTFGIESRFGFNKTTLSLYFSDKLKGLILGILIGGPFLYVVLWVMQATGEYWWIWAFVFITLFQLLMIIIVPTFIAPWFNKFEPLASGELRDRILALAKQIGFKSSGIFLMDGSKRSAHSNAYFTGIGKAKRIVLFDTLIEQMTIDQGLAVLAHEMGHYKMKHIRRMMVVQAVFLFIGLYILSRLVNYQPLFTAFGLQPSNHAALILFSLLSGPFTFYLGPLMNLLSRKHEYEADRFAAITLRNGKPMEEALINLTVKNLSNLTPHPWYSAYHYSHPTPTERIGAIRRITT